VSPEPIPLPVRPPPLTAATCATGRALGEWRIRLRIRRRRLAELLHAARTRAGRRDHLPALAALAAAAAFALGFAFALRRR
jgi:hypothetical protein